MTINQVRQKIEIEEYYYDGTDVIVTFYNNEWPEEQPCETVNIEFEIIEKQIEDLGYQVKSHEGELEVNTGDDKHPFDIWMSNLPTADIYEMLTIYFTEQMISI